MNPLYSTSFDIYRNYSNNTIQINLHRDKFQSFSSIFGDDLRFEISEFQHFNEINLMNPINDRLLFFDMIYDFSFYNNPKLLDTALIKYAIKHHKKILSLFVAHSGLITTDTEIQIEFEEYSYAKRLNIISNNKKVDSIDRYLDLNSSQTVNLQKYTQKIMDHIVLFYENTYNMAWEDILEMN